MFDFSFAEFSVVILIAMLILGPAEVIEIIKNLRKYMAKMRSWYDSYIQYLNKALADDAEENHIVGYTTDLEGNLRETYDLSRIMPDLKKDTVDNTKHTNE